MNRPKIERVPESQPRETHLPTEQIGAKASARFPRPDGDQRWAQSSRCASRADKGTNVPDTVRRGHDYVLIGRRAALILPFGEMMQELDAALGRIHVAAAGGTGGAQPGALHEAGSPAKAREARRSGRRPP